jgi:hypothetical protein
MKNAARWIWIVFFVAGVYLVPGFGQARQTTYHIPFDFVVDQTTFVAGDYEVSSVFESSLALRHPDGTPGIVISAKHVATADRSMPCMLVFNRYGNTYFLSQAWLGLRDRGWELYVSEAEKEIAQKIARTAQIVASAR